MPQSASSFLDDTPAPSTGSADSFLGGGNQVDSFLSDAAPKPSLFQQGFVQPTISPAEEPGILSRALTSARESISPLIGPTADQVARRTAQTAQFAEQFPQIASQAVPQAYAVEGAIPALSHPILPEIQASGPGYQNALGAAAYNTLVRPLSSPLSALTLPLAGAVNSVPAIGRAVSGLFGADMLRGAVEGAPAAYKTITDPNATPQQKIEAGLSEASGVALGGLAGIHALDARLAGKTPEQAVKAIRDEVKATDDKRISDALTDAADTLDRQIAAQDAAQKQAQDAAKAQETQAKAEADAQQQAQEAAVQAAQPPKSTQILAEPQTNPPALANVATEIATQTKQSPYALQEKLNELTTVPEDAPAAPAQIQPASALLQIGEEGTAPAVKAPEPLTKSAAISQALKTPDAEFQYTVFRPGEGIPSAIQVDAIADGRSLVSSSPAELRKAGADIPEVPEWVPQGQYTREQIKEFIKKGEPKEAEPVTPQAPATPISLSDVNESRLSALAKQLNIDPKGMSGDRLRARIESNAHPDTISEALAAPAPDIIEKLQSKKRVGKGRVTDAAQGLVDAAHDAAIDLAILAIRSGRGIAEVIQAAVAKFRSMHKDATPEQVRDLVADISSAQGYESRPAASEVENIMADAPSIVPAAGRPPEVTQAAAARRGAFSRAEAWADRTLADIKAQGRVNAGIDPTELAAHTVKLAAQLERGAVDFAKWSAEKIAEVGEQIRPYLQKIWDTAHEQIQAQRVMPGDERGVSKSALGKYDYVKTTNKAQIEAAQPILDYVKSTGDFNGGFARLRSIENTADRAVASAVLLNEAEGIKDPITRDQTVRRLAAEILQGKTDSGQGLQAQAAVNEIIAPYRAHLAWMDLIQSRLRDAIKLPEETAGKINEGFKEAGNKAAERLVVDAPGASSLLRGAIKRIQGKTDLDWKQVFTDLPENQAARQREIFDRILADPKVAALPEEVRTKLAATMTEAWESLRDGIFRQEFAKVVGLPDIPKPDAVKLERSLPEIIKQANLGLLDNEAFRNALAKEYNVQGLDEATGNKLRELGQKAQRTPEGIERNMVYQEIKDTLMEAKGVNPWDFLKDYWYRNVMSAPRTAVEIGSGGIVQGIARTFTTALDTAVAQRRPDVALRLIGMFLKDAGVGARLGADLVKSGDRTILPRYNQQFLEAMDRFESGKSPGGEIESLFRRRGTGTKIALAPFELTGRLLTALDYIGGQGVRQQQMAYAALTRGDKASFDASMKRFNSDEVTAAKQRAKAEMPQGRPAQLIARTREILNEGISKEIQEFGNNMTEVTALNAAPVGLGGSIYEALSRLPMLVRAPTGLAFVKAGLNLFQEYSNWAPITGQINAARALWRNPGPKNPLRWLALDKLPPERARQIIVSQGTGLALLAAAAAKFLAPQDEDKNGKPRKMEISGGWTGLTPTQKSALLSAGEKPYAIKLPSGRWVDYKMTPFLPALATIGHARDQERFGGKTWTDETASTHAVNAWLMGLASVKDLSVASQTAQLAGMLASDNRELNEKTIAKRLVDSVGNAAMGLVPMNSLLRELDNYGDPQRYRPDSNNPGVDTWLQQVPYARRDVGDGKSPMLNFLGQPVQVNITPFNRHIGELPSTQPLEAALSEKVSAGMRLPTLSDNSTVVAKDDKGQLVMRPMTSDENYAYQKAVRQGYAHQMENDLPAFNAATPAQAALYSQAVFNRAEQYARDRMNLRQPIGDIPADPKLSSALGADYEAVKNLDAQGAPASTEAHSQLRTAYDRIEALPPAQRGAALRDELVKDRDFGTKLIQYTLSPVRERTALEKATGGLEPDTRAEYYAKELAKRSPDERRTFLAQQVKAGLITAEVLRELAKQSPAKN